MPVLEPTAMGRKSGEARSVMLASPLQVGTTAVIVASRGGDDMHPAWLLNIRDNPNVEVMWKGEARKPMYARIATSARAA
jgi:deazaflavin-dependent oxidoreductase (nitroreductase family)